MGTHFTAVMNHNFDEHQLSDLPDLLNRIWPSVEPLLPMIEGYPVAGIPPSKWRWSERDFGFSLARLLHNETAMLDSYEFSGNVSRHVFALYHVLRWSSFLTDSTVRGKLRQICRHVASAFGSNQVVYLPSGFLKPEGAIGLMYKGKAVEDMIHWLRENCGPAAQNVDFFDSKDLHNRHYPELENWYYIEKIQASVF